MPFYFENGLPSTAQKTTDSYGLAGAINVDVGTVTATATPPSKADAAAPTDLSITFDVRPGAVTFALLRNPISLVHRRRDPLQHPAV